MQPSTNALPNWLQQSFALGAGTGSLGHLVWRLVLALLLGGVVAAIYRGTHRHEPITPSFPRTLVLLALLIAMAWNCPALRKPDLQHPTLNIQRPTPNPHRLRG